MHLDIAVALELSKNGNDEGTAARSRTQRGIRNCSARSRSWPRAATSSPRSNHYSRQYLRTSTIAYLANKLWQRTRRCRPHHQLSVERSGLGKSIDAARIGVAGHSQGGFTALWIGGAKVTPTSISPSSAAGAK